MSSFYLSAVKGDIPVHLLEIISLRRLEYLKAILSENTVVYNEYVIEGSTYDNVGHFMLCVAANLNENTEFLSFFINAEIELFRRRLESLSAYDIRSFAKKLLRSTKKYGEPPAFFEPLQVLCQHLCLKDIAHHISTYHDISCNVHNITVHFKQCLTFVARRQVEIKCGSALIPCGRWKQYLTLLFMNNLYYKLGKNLAPVKNDNRIIELLLKIKKEFVPMSNKPDIIHSKEIDNLSIKFPPCMLNLHLNLRTKHRLTHLQRFYYSLFLKDIGMPVEESISFWKAEYQLIPNGSHSCCHNWERDEKKYLYGIRHMYGLEGGRRNYSSVSCKQIQSTEGASSEGGCPFKTFDDYQMLKLLKHPTESILSRIQELRNIKQYTKACMLTLGINTCENFGFNFSPVKYYIISSKSTTY